MEYIYEKLKRYSKSKYYPFHMPGHKRNFSITGSELPYDIDITEIDGFDDLHHPSGLLKYAQERAAALFQAEETHFLVNGSSAGLLSAIIGSTSRGGRILMARNCHKSVYNAVMLNELHPVYIYPQTMTEAAVSAPIAAGEVMKLIDQYPDVQAVVITSPTYDGVVSDIAAISDVLHEKSIPLIVDQAHGAHFGMHSYFPPNANVQGADIVVQSVHKTLPSLTQTALLHINGNLADREKVNQYLSIFQSSSPSYVLMAAIDECVRVLEEKRESIFNPYVDLLGGARERLKKSLQSLKLIETADYDRSKILIYSGDIFEKNKKEINKYTGKQLYDELKEKYLLQMEMATPLYILGMTSPGDTKEGIGRFVSALEEIDGKLAKKAFNEGYNSKSRIICKNKQVCTPYEADRLRHVPCDRSMVSNLEEQNRHVLEIAKSQNYTALEYAYVYPPGIPIIVPGEKISAETVAKLLEYQDTGFEISGTKTKGKIEVLENG